MLGHDHNRLHLLIGLHNLLIYNHTLGHDHSRLHLLIGLHNLLNFNHIAPRPQPTPSVDRPPQSSHLQSHAGPRPQPTPSLIGLHNLLIYNHTLGHDHSSKFQTFHDQSLSLYSQKTRTTLELSTASRRMNLILTKSLKWL
ncbi:hypothetical protein BgiBS90_037881 [Biomphalaria glabrata]|nr:hypothetical protein BgiBS90_037881 [Biomphalaria glabrata]